MGFRTQTDNLCIISYIALVVHRVMVRINGNYGVTNGFNHHLVSAISIIEIIEKGKLIICTFAPQKSANSLPSLSR